MSRVKKGLAARQLDLVERSRDQRPLTVFPARLFSIRLDGDCRSLGKIDLMKITPARRIKGRLRLPGDKSISHRAALIAALAKGESHLANFSTSRTVLPRSLACVSLEFRSSETEMTFASRLGAGIEVLAPDGVA